MMEQEEIKMKMTPQWEKSKETIWEETFASLEAEQPERKRVQRNRMIWRAVAAIFLLALLPSFARLYTKTEKVTQGHHAEILLPDASSVVLNAESQISYKPYWWFASRTVDLVGEAFFDVKRGSPFLVRSATTRIKVLGTSFNVIAREELYQVTCLTGKIEVSTDSQVMPLHPNMRVTQMNDLLHLDEQIDASQSVTWIHDLFSFNRVPLRFVISEIERQYAIRIQQEESDLDQLFTGNFTKERQPEEILEIIGRPFGLKFNIER